MCRRPRTSVRVDMNYLGVDARTGTRSSRHCSTSCRSFASTRLNRLRTSSAAKSMSPSLDDKTAINSIKSPYLETHNCQPPPHRVSRRGERWSRAGICAGWQDFLTLENSEQAVAQYTIHRYSKNALDFCQFGENSRNGILCTPSVIHPRGC